MNQSAPSAHPFKPTRSALQAQYARVTGKPIEASAGMSDGQLLAYWYLPGGCVRKVAG